MSCKGFLLLAVALAAAAICTASPYVFPGTPVPNDTLRVVALGSGPPSVSRSQFATSYLLQLGSNQKNLLFDCGTGSIINLYATQVDLATIDKVRSAPGFFLLCLDATV